jgi:fumarate hydratase subunit beta
MTSAFSRRVYRVVEGIPLGERRTYGWVAERAGKRRAYRAVGQILKRNAYPLVIPCHRVIKSDSSVGGYLWGKMMKKELLQLELDEIKNSAKRISLPLDKERIANLKVGDEVLLSGVLYTARDRAHKRMVKAIKKGRKLPFSLKNQLIYYCGPTPSRRGKVIGSCGPTSSLRMDEFTPLLLKRGLRGMIGKGRRSKEVRRAIKRYQAVYFLAIGGIGALLSRYVRKAEVIGYKDLAAEAIYRLEVKDFPVIVGIDREGRSIYEES